MARREMGMEELRAVKENLNKEGTQMEEGEEGGAAVYVGSKEEVTKARQLAETEGKAPDLASYIVMHKQVIATSQELMEYLPHMVENFGKLQAGAMTMPQDFGHKYMPKIFYKDSAGNFVKVEIDLEKIASLKSELSKFEKNDDNKKFSIVQDELIELGFRNTFPRDAGEIEKLITNARLKKIITEQEKGFAF